MKCKCGCGNNVTKKQNIYLLGHNHKGKTYEEIYGKLAEEKKEIRRIALTGKPRDDMIGDKNIAKRPEVRKKMRKGVKESWIVNPTLRITDDVIKKIRETKEKNGTCIKEKDLDNFELYKRRVIKFTRISIKEKYSENDLKNIGRGKDKDSIDHIFSVYEGFVNYILPQVIGSKCNIRILNFSQNSIKHTRCDISRDKLFKKYNEEVSFYDRNLSR